VTCPSCGHENPAGARFCNGCGATLEGLCPRCGKPNPARSRFCNGCGEPFQAAAMAERVADPRSYTPKHLAERILAEQAALEARGAEEGERKHITALFADIQGSVELMETLDPEEARSIVDPALRIMMDAVHDYEGYVAQSRGDGILALFGAPIAQEDHARRALYAALRMQEEITRFSGRLRVAKGVPLSIRVGLNSGEVVVRSIRKDDLHTDYVPIGHSVNLAARMESLATPGSIAVSESTFRAAEGYFRFREVGPVAVKGVREPVRVYELDGVGALHTPLEVSRSRGFSRFVGRENETATLEAALSRAIGGTAQVVGIVGEPGVGKSRLCFEFLERCRVRGLPIFEARGVAHGKSLPLLPMLELFRSFFGITEEDTDQAAREKIAGRYVLLDESLRELLPLVFDLLGVSDPERPAPPMEPDARQRQLVGIVKRVTQMWGRRQPAVTFLEDLQWFDGGSEAFLEPIVEALPGTQWLVLVTFRPEYHAGWMQKSYYQQLPVLPLAPDAIAELLKDLLGADSSLAALGSRIRERTGGNPFFIEEVVQALAETGVLDGARGAYRLKGPAAELRIPATVQTVLAARIDRLAEREKGVLETAAVIGRQFTEPVLQRVSELREGELAASLARLTSAEFIYEEAIHPQAQYTFKHALTHEVAYNSLLNERRLTLHEHAAQAIEGLFAGRLDEHLSELAHHYSHSRNTEKAIEYSRLAGERAVQLSANVEAISQLSRGLELLKALPDAPERTQELALQVALGVPLRAVRGFSAPEVGRTYARARELCQQVGETPELVPVLRGLWEFYELRAEFRTAFERAEELLGLAERVQDRALLLAAHDAVGDTSFWVGEFPAARAHLEEGVRLYDVEQHRSHAFLHGYDSGVACLSFGAYALWFLGYPDQALRRVTEALSLARGLDHTFSQAFAMHFSAQLHHYRRECQVARDQSAEVLRISIVQSFPIWLGCAEVIHGWALAETGQAQEGLTQMRQGIADWRASGHELEVPHFLGLLAEAHGRTSQPAEGLEVLTEALTIVERSGERFWEAELQRVYGELSLRVAAPATRRSPVLASAEESFQKAIEIARRQRAKSLELRAVTSLSRLLQKQSKKEEARQMLAEIYGWFTEGFDTADLKDAKALLEELS
jgi:class 3 adenylate cyclase/predicted ATPase